MIATRSSGWIGVDIGVSTVKVAQVSRRHGRFHLTEAAVVERLRPWPGSGLAQETPRPSRNEIAGALSLGGRFRGRMAGAVASLAVGELLSMQLPEGGAGSLRTQVAQRLGLNSSRGQQGVSFDCWPTNHPADRTGIVDNAGALTVRDAWADCLVSDLGSAGLRCQTLDGIPTSLPRMMRFQAGYDAAQPFAVLDWGYSQALFCVLFGGRPIYSRCLKRCGLHHLLDSASEKAGLTVDDTTHLLLEHGLPGARKMTPPQQVFAEIAAELIETIESELRRTLTHLRSHRAHIVPSRLCIVGGGATIRNLAPTLTARLPWEFHVWDPRRALNVKCDTHRDLLPLLGPAIAMSVLAWEEA